MLSEPRDGLVGVRDQLGQEPADVGVDLSRMASPEDRAEQGAWVGCIAGALSAAEYEAGLAAAGFHQVTVTFIHQVGDGLHSAIVKATRPAGAS